VQIVEKCVGNLDNIKWPDLKKVGLEISKLLTGPFEFIELSVDVTQYCRVLENEYYSGIMIGLRDIELPHEKINLIQSACLLLFNNIVDNSKGERTQEGVVTVTFRH
jgi:hypothetical protein